MKNISFIIKPHIVSLIIIIILSTAIMSSCKQDEAMQPKPNFSLQYRILWDENLSGEEVIEQAKKKDYDIVFLNAVQLMEAREKVKDIAIGTLVVFDKVSLNRAIRYIDYDGFDIEESENIRASCLYINESDGKPIHGEFQSNDSPDELLETISEYWYEIQDSIGNQ
ncbi:MAG: hypothetical protein IKX16_07790 [Clostridia bacterium]|nr:hypothetical protein [Clostridia bacterium]